MGEDSIDRMFNFVPDPVAREKAWFEELSAHYRGKGKLLSTEALKQLTAFARQRGYDFETIGPVLEQAALFRTIDDAKQLLDEHLERLEDDRDTRMVTGTQLLTLPDPDWAIKGLMPPTGKGQIYGPSYVGKSLLALDLCLSISNGCPTWQGFEVAMRGPAVYVAMEGGFDLKARVQAWLTGHPSCSADWLGLLIEERVNLANEASVRRLVDDIKLGGGRGIRLLVIDTQGLATPGVDENSNTAMNQVLVNVGLLNKQLGCFVLLVHHTGWDEGHERGASAQRGAMDLRLAVGDGTMTVEKVKAGEAGTTRYFKRERPAGCTSVYAKAVEDAGTFGEMAKRLGNQKSKVHDYVATNAGVSKTKVVAHLKMNRTKGFALLKNMASDPVDPLVERGGKLYIEVEP